MIDPTTREEWEALSVDELKKHYSEQQLKDALREHFGLKSHIYFMGVAKKREYITNPDARRTLLAEAEERQKAHQSRGAEHRGKKSVKELVAERSEDRAYTFAGVERHDSFTDPFNDRVGKVAYVITDVADGERFPTQKQTAKLLTELGRLSGFDERITAKKQKPAHKAGAQTMEDVIANGDPRVQEAVKAVETMEEPEAIPATEPDPNRTDLDDILNALPQ